MRGFGSWLPRELVQTQSLDKASYDNQVLVLSENDAQKFVGSSGFKGIRKANEKDRLII
jgi:hypothetical protein